jgi:hypothetical protein
VLLEYIVAARLKPTINKRLGLEGESKIFTVTFHSPHLDTILQFFF